MPKANEQGVGDQSRGNQSPNNQSRGDQFRANQRGRAPRRTALLTGRWLVAGRQQPTMARERRSSIAVVGGAVVATPATVVAIAADPGAAYLVKLADQRTAGSAHRGAMVLVP